MHSVKKIVDLFFGSGNEKMRSIANFLKIMYSQVVSFDIPAGYSCSKADICKTFAHRITGKLKMHGSVKCFAARDENYLPSVRRRRWLNYTFLLSLGNDIDKIALALNANIKKNIKIVRIHSSGDFYSYFYFLAWVQVAKMRPDISFFGYTKHLEYVLYQKPSNFKLNFSYGSLDDGLRDDIVKKYNIEIPTAYINEYDNQYPNIKLICTSEDDMYADYPAILNNESFALGMH